MFFLCFHADAAIIFDDNENLRKNIIRYFLSDNRQIHQIYAIRFLMCEIMNFFAVVSVHGLVFFVLQPISNHILIQYIRNRTVLQHVSDANGVCRFLERICTGHWRRIQQRLAKMGKAYGRHISEIGQMRC